MMNVDYTNIRDLKPGMKNLNLIFIILDMGRPNVTKEGHEVRSCKVADKSGSVNVSLWDEPGQLLQSGDICKLTKGYVSLWKGCLTLYSGKGGDVLKIGEFCLVFSECPFMSEPNVEYIQAQQAKLQGESRSTSPTGGGPSAVPASPDARSGPVSQGGGNGSALQPVSFQRNNLRTGQPALLGSAVVRPSAASHTNGMDGASNNNNNNNNSNNNKRISRR